MRERIYLPILRQTRVLIESMKTTNTALIFGNEDDANKTINDHLFFAAHKPIGDEFVELLDKCSKYRQIYNAAYVELCKIVTIRVVEAFRINIAGDPSQV
jgi:hypothetical protein